MMQKLWLFVLLLGVLSDLSGQTALLSLEGEWRFEQDPQDKGRIEKWFERELSDEVRLRDR